MNNKTLSIVSYITYLGWLFAFFSGKSTADSLLKYHLRQSFGLLFTSVVFAIAMAVLLTVLPFLDFLSYVGFFIPVLMVLGIINASNGVEKPLPVIGKFFEGKFRFIG